MIEPFLFSELCCFLDNALCVSMVKAACVSAENQGHSIMPIHHGNSYCSCDRGRLLAEGWGVGQPGGSLTLGRLGKGPHLCGELQHRPLKPQGVGR